MRYHPITEKSYCCVPAVLQMIQERRGMGSMTQDEIGWELGLIVPPCSKAQFTKVRTGPEPKAGYGTQTAKPEYCIENYSHRHRLLLSMTKTLPPSLEEMISIIEEALEQDDDIIVCYRSRHLFGDGDLEHASLIESFNKAGDRVTVVDPAIDAPRIRSTTPVRLFDTILNHGTSASSGLWIVSDTRCACVGKRNKNE